MCFIHVFFLMCDLTGTCVFGTLWWLLLTALFTVRSFSATCSSVHLPPLDSLLINPPLSFLLSWLWGHGARHGPQAPAAYHWWKEGLDQHAGPPPQAPAPKLPGPRLTGQSAGHGSNRGLLHQRIIGGQHQGISDWLTLSFCVRHVFRRTCEAKS